MAESALPESRRFACYNCGQYWEVDENYEIHKPNEPANICPECGRVGQLQNEKL